jgi:hypothetical protein
MMRKMTPRVCGPQQTFVSTVRKCSLADLLQLGLVDVDVASTWPHPQLQSPGIQPASESRLVLQHVMRVNPFK